MSLTKDSKYPLSSGYEIPVIGLGVFLSSGQETIETVYQALKIGYRHIDSAQLYENEYEVGQGILKWIKEDPENNKRGDVFYTTKARTDAQGYELTKQKLNESFEKVKELKYIDLVLVHSPRTDPERRLGTYKALQEFVDSGLVRSIGVSNYGEKHLNELLNWKELKYKPTINQIELHPWLLRSKITEFCFKNDIKVEAFSPLTRGQKLNDPTLIEIASKYKKSPAQILIRWSLQCGFIPLPKSVTVSRLKENLDVFGFELSNEDFDKLKALDENFLTSPKNGDMLYYEP